MENKVVILGTRRFTLDDRALYDANGDPVDLRAKSLRFLLFLLEKNGRVVTKSELAETVWKGLSVTDESISQCASDIRRFLGDADHAVLETFPKRGYRLNARAKPPLETKTQKRTLVVAAVVLVGVLAMAAKNTLFPERVTDMGPLRKVVAVLPFQNAELETADEPIANGLAQDLTIRLAEVSSVEVVPSSLAFSVTEKGLKAVDSARSLGARYIVVGGVGIRGDRLEVSIELVDAELGTIQWADSFNGTSGQLVEIRDMIIAEIAAEVSGKISEKDLDRLRSTGTENAEAYQDILRGRLAAASFTKEMSHVAERHFREAVERDPAYARAYAELAALYAIRFENGWTVLKTADEEKALYFAQKALALDDDLWLAHYAMGRLHSIFATNDFSMAEYHLERAMALQPANDDARIYYGAVKIFQGKSQEALDIVAPVLATHPNPPFWYHLTLGHANLMLGRHEEAERSLDQCLEQMALAPYCLRFQIANYGAMGRQEDALWLLEEYALLGFNRSLADVMSLILGEAPEYRQQLESAFRAAGLTD